MELDGGAEGGVGDEAGLELGRLGQEAGGVVGKGGIEAGVPSHTQSRIGDWWSCICTKDSDPNPSWAEKTLIPIPLRYHSDPAQAHAALILILSDR